MYTSEYTLMAVPQELPREWHNFFAVKHLSGGIFKVFNQEESVFFSEVFSSASFTQGSKLYR